MSADAINASIAAARALAANAANTAADQETGGGAVAVPGAGTAVAQSGGKPVSLGEVLNQGGLRVDAYLKVDKTGFLIGTDLMNTFEEIDVEFRLGDVVPYYGLRYGASPTKYLKSFDRLVESRTKKSWQAAISEAMASDPKCRGDYPTVDIPFTMRETLTAEKGEKKGQALIEAGQTLGWTASVTNFKDFAAFIKPFDDMRTLGQIDDNLILAGKLKFKARSGNGNNWGAALFDDFKVVDISFKDSQSEG
ncbi:hypothetical protein CPT_Seuss71 [Caulobacter phage Seuss]|uniref:Uncharacterized protein n=1 Tax=Caulobacter phage Seuss TaxID=1675601 RepID=A0A0K1LM51_9CAUD|nr:hypothetical protein HOR08_gp071 [Caulobacter phage Seuss]AKU43597.1 hypothetical protein CPT_Seuss71 [Caulobacter phage Seuss]